MATLPERVESTEERITRLEELFRSTMEDIARTAQRIADRMPSDPRIHEAVERLIKESGQTP